jgi:hypothetical protein
LTASSATLSMPVSESDTVISIHVSRHHAERRLSLKCPATHVAAQRSHVLRGVKLVFVFTIGSAHFAKLASLCAGATYITFHPEATKHIDRSLSLIRAGGCKSGLVLNPATVSPL